MLQLQVPFLIKICGIAAVAIGYFLLDAAYTVFTNVAIFSFLLVTVVAKCCSCNQVLLVLAISNAAVAVQFSLNFPLFSLFKLTTPNIARRTAKKNLTSKVLHF